MAFFVTQGSGALIMPSHAYGNSAVVKSQNGTGFYVVKQRDTLSEVLRSLGLVPIYGQRGTLRQLLDCGQFERNGNLIRPGQKVFLSHDAATAKDDLREIRLTEAGIALSEASFPKPSTTQSVGYGRCASLVVSIGPNGPSQTKPVSSRSITSTTPSAEATNSHVSSGVVKLDGAHDPALTQDLPGDHEPSAILTRSETTDESLALRRQSQVASAPSDEKPNTLNDSSVSGSTFALELLQGFSRLDLQTSAGGYSELLSKPFEGFSLDWREQLSRNLSVDLLVSKFKIPPSEPAGVSVQGEADFSVIGLGFLLLPVSGSGLSVGPIFKYQTTPISTRIGSGIIRVDSPQVFLAGVKLEHMLPLDQGRKLKSNFSAWYAPYSGQSDFSISNGYGFIADVRMLRPIVRNLDLSGGFSYGFSSFKTSLGNHARQDLMLGLGFIYRFDGLGRDSGQSDGGKGSQKGDHP